MKRCPSCNRTFDDDVQSFCPTDGSRLVDAAAAPPASEDYLQATIMAPPSARPSSELPPPDAYATNANSSGQFNQQPPAQTPAAAPWPENQYQAKTPPWPSQPSPPPPPAPTWQTPAAQPAAPKSGINPKLLIGGGIGCAGLLIIGVIGIAIIAMLGGPSRKMNPYKGSLRDLAPTSISSYTRVDVDTLGDRDKKDFGRVRDAIGVAYRGASSDEKVLVFIGSYDSADDAKDGLNSFKSKITGDGWSLTSDNVRPKKIGWSTVGSIFRANRSTASIRDGSLPDGARLVQAQSSSPSPSPAKKNPTLLCWTNGSVLYAVVGSSWAINQFEGPFDNASK